MADLVPGAISSTLRPELEPQAPTKGLTPGGISQRLGSTPKVVPGSISRALGKDRPLPSSSKSVDKPIDVYKILSGHDSITASTVVENDDMMEVVYRSLESRNKNAPNQTAAGRGLTWLLGGQTLKSKNWRDMDREDVFEVWQNYQRSFAGGNSTTNVNELTYALNADDKTKADLGAGYVLFDAMDNAYTGEGTWGDTLDATRDYVVAGVWDPLTVATLGIGKAASMAGSKAGNTAARQALIKVYKSSLKAGLSKATAKKVAAGSVAAATTVVPEIALNAAVDVAHQNTRMTVGVQEDYSVAQTGLVAVGTVVTPAILAATGGMRFLRKAKIDPESFAAYQKVDKRVVQEGLDNLDKIMKSTVNMPNVINSLDADFGTIKGVPGAFKDWDTFKKISRAGQIARGEEATDWTNLADFKQAFLLGVKDADGNQIVKGYSKALEEAGFVMSSHFIEKYGKAGGIAQTVSWLSDSTVETYMKNWEKASGRSLGLEYTAEALSQNIAQSASEAGRISGQMARFLKQEGLNPKQAAKAIAGVDTPEEAAQYGQFALSIYKRLLTSHPATTAANLKGFGVVSMLNSYADIFTGAINAAQYGFYKGINNTDQAIKYYNRMSGAFKGIGYKGANLMAPDGDFKMVDAIFDLFPDAEKALFRDVAGDGGVRDNPLEFGIKGSRIAKGVDNYTATAQGLAGVRLQDEITKRWAFDANFNQALMREFGEDINTFFANPDNMVHLGSKRFQENVMDKALYRTLRETASVNWSQQKRQTADWMRRAAKGVAYVSNNTPAGVIIPFGNFMNTTMATMGDLTFINFGRAAIRKAAGSGVEYSSQEIEELLAKGIVGVGVVAIGVPAARERILNGQAWNADTDNKGDARDVTFDWPASTLRLMSQITAHATAEGGFDRTLVPEDLRNEFIRQTAGQVARDFEDFFRPTVDIFNDFMQGDANMAEMVGVSFGSVLGQFAQGVTRPLDPLNQLAGVIKGREMTPDLRQGSRNWNEARKYVNHIFGLMDDLPKRNYPTSTEGRHVDIGKVIGGSRRVRPQSTFEQVLNTIGAAHWKQAKWKGPAELRNFMDDIAQEFYEAETNRRLKILGGWEKFTSMSHSDKVQLVREINGKVSTQLTAYMNSAPAPQALNSLRLLNGQAEYKVRKVKELLGIEEDLEELIKTPEGILQLERINALVKSYDDVFGVLDE